MNNKVLVLGHLGLKNNSFDGQTIKTRNIYELLKSKNEEIGTIDYFDTQSFKSDILSPFKLLWKLLKCNKLIYLPAHNNLKYLFPLIYLISRLNRIEILYFIVGGWLDEYLQSKRLHVSLLYNIRGIFSESKQLQQNLIDHYKFKNVLTFPNFRIHAFKPTFNHNIGTLKIVFLARIFRLKGIDTIFRMAEHIQNTSNYKHKYTIDFYGSIEKIDEDYFREQIKRFEFISYKGVLEQDRIYQKLSEYDLLILPTRYPGEGFPGTIMDAYISGIPVIVSNWKYLSEFVDHGKSGFLFDLTKEEELFNYIDKLYRHRELLFEMKKNAFKKSISYSSGSAWNIIKDYLTT